MRLVRGADVWEIWHEGTMVRTNGALRRFRSAEHARVVYEAAVTEKRREGFVDAPDIIENLDARLVYADELQLRGDPLGELIAVQLALSTLPESAAGAQRRKLERRVVGLLEEHHDALFGPLASQVRRPSRTTPASPAVAITWRLGFADEIRIQRSSRLELHEVYALLRTLPLTRFMTKLVVGEPGGPWMPGASPPAVTYSALFATMVKDGVPAHLRSLVIGDSPRHDRGDILLGDLRRVVEACPALEELAITNAHGIITPLVAPRLKKLVFESISESALRDIPRSTLPALEELVIDHGHATALLRLLFGHPLLAQLRALTLRRCRLGDADLRSIIQHAARLAHLEHLDLRGNKFSRDLVRDARTGGGVGLPHLKA